MRPAPEGGGSSSPLKPPVHLWTGTSKFFSTVPKPPRLACFSSLFSKTLNRQFVRLAHFLSFACSSCRRPPARLGETCSFCSCCCCKPCGLVPQERIAPGSRSGLFRMPNNEVRSPLHELELLSHLHWNPLLVALGCVYPAVCVHFVHFNSSSESGPERYWCRFDRLIHTCSLCAHLHFPSQAMRNRVKTGVSGSRRSIDIVSNEYA